MTWTQEVHSGEKGYRSDNHYVGQSSKGFYRLWIRGETKWSRHDKVFVNASEAKAFAESL